MRLAEAEDQAAKHVLLDLCCGPGRCTIALAKRGFSVTGRRSNEASLEQGAGKIQSRAGRDSVGPAGLRHFVRPGTFDLVISMFTSFGYFDNKADDLTGLKNMFMSLRYGGICLVDVMGKEVLAGILQHTISDRLPDGRTFIQRHEVFDEWTRIRNEWLLIRKDEVKRFTFHHTVYSGQELQDRMEQVGFTDVILYGNLDGDEYGPNAKRLIAVGRKHKA